MFAGKQRRLENSPLVAESSTLMPTTGEDCYCRATNAVAGCELHETRRLGWWLAGPLPLPCYVKTPPRLSLRISCSPVAAANSPATGRPPARQPLPSARRVSSVLRQSSSPASADDDGDLEDVPVRVPTEFSEA
nr:hypothetical protein Iba_chr04dCG13520 [Ipomoea batatas]